MGQTSEVLVNQTFNFPLIGDQPSLFEAKITDGASRLEHFRKSKATLFSQFLNIIPTSKNESIVFPRLPLVLKALIGRLPGLSKALF